MTSVHHIELWVPDIAKARPRWAWIMAHLAWVDFQDWPGGHSWKAVDGAYLVIEQSPDMTGDRHDRTHPGLNHLALTAPSSDLVDAIVAEAPSFGWQLMFKQQYPYAGGPDHYAAYLVDDDGYELEIVAQN